MVVDLHIRLGLTLCGQNLTSRLHNTIDHDQVILIGELELDLIWPDLLTCGLDEFERPPAKACHHIMAPNADLLHRILVHEDHTMLRSDLHPQAILA